jgi:streptogramin lyase
VEEFVLPTLNAQPLGIAMDNDGGMWFEESTLGKLIRIKKSEVAKSQNTK